MQVKKTRLILNNNCDKEHLKYRRQFQTLFDPSPNLSMLLKPVYGKLDDDTMSEVKHIMSCIVTYPISAAIVESWGSTIGLSYTKQGCVLRSR